MFRIHGEVAATVSGEVLNSSDQLVASKVLVRREGGYLFSHSFSALGLFTIKVVDSSGGTHYDAVVVTPKGPTKEEIRDAVYYGVP